MCHIKGEILIPCDDRACPIKNPAATMDQLQGELFNIFLRVHSAASTIQKPPHTSEDFQSKIKLPK